MKSLILVATLAFVAIQLTCAAPTPEDEKKEAAAAASPKEIVEAAPAAAEAKAEEGFTVGVKEPSPSVVREATVGSAVAAKKEQ